MKCKKKRGNFLREVLIMVMIFSLINITPILAQTQRITLNLKNSSISEVFRKIKSETDLSVVYNVDDVTSDKKINYEAKDKPLNEVLDYVLNEIGGDLSYIIQDEHIVISSGTQTATTTQVAQQTRSISGVVTDTEGDPVIGATVVLKSDQSIGTATDFDGKYSLANIPNNATLIVSYVGMSSQEITVTQGTTVYNITLSDDSELLDELVVTALGIKRSEKALSYNVQQVDNESLTRAKDINFVNNLSGKVAGVNISRSSAGIGGATRVVMRGSKSIVGNNNVLYVVDGMPIGNSSRGVSDTEFSAPVGGEGISDFNPDDIESISVLSGPSAAALYGAAAANGVIVINTKKGTEGKLRIDFSSNNEFMNPLFGPEFQSNYGNKPGSYRSWGEKLEAPSTFDPLEFFETGFNTTNSLNLSTGTKTNQTFISVASTNSSGIIPNNKYYRHNFSLRNTSLALNDKLHLDFGASYVLQGDQNMLSQGRYFNPLFPLYLFPRGEDFESVKVFERYDGDRRFPVQYWPFGDQGLSFENPYWIVNRELFPSEKKRYMLHGRAQYDIFDWLDIAGRIRIDNTSSENSRKLFASTLQLHTNSPKGSYIRNQEEYMQTYADVMANINKTFGDDYSLTMNIGSSFEDHYTSGIGIGGRLMTVPNLFSAANIFPEGAGSESYHRTRNVAVFASAELGWKNKLYLSATGRTDWASQLVSNGNTPAIFYPSVGISGIITDMVELPDFISYLKLRTSYTEVGSPISQVGITPGTVTDPMNGGVIDPISTYPYPDFKPERTKSYEAGVNARFWNGKINLDGTVYQSNTYNQTFLSSMSPASGYSGFYVQAGNVRNRGVELSLGYNDKFGKVNYATNVTFTTNENKIIEMVDDYTNPIDNSKFSITELTLQEAGGVYLREGYSMSDLFVQGILQRDKDGKLIPEGNGFQVDRSQRIRIGSADPDFTMGWHNEFAYKNISFGVLLTGRFGGIVTSQTQAFMDEFGVSKVSADARENGGVMVDGEMYDAERYFNTVGGQQLMAYYAYDATNIRLQELSLTYSLPQRLLGNVFNNASISFIGRNLLMIYRAAPYDSDMTSSTGTYNRGDFFMPPSLRNLGFSVKFGL